MHALVFLKKLIEKIKVQIERKTIMTRFFRKNQNEAIFEQFNQEIILRLTFKLHYFR